MRLNAFFIAPLVVLSVLDIEAGKPDETLGITGVERVFLHEVMVYIPGGPIKTVAGFSDNLSVAGLLGMTGFFEHFKIVFDPTTLRVELERLYLA